MAEPSVSEDESQIEGEYHPEKDSAPGQSTPDSSTHMHAHSRHLYPINTTI